MWEVVDPTPLALTELIRRLDADAWTEVTVSAAQDRYLMIGGGAGQYVVCAALDDSAFWNLVSNEQASGTVYVTAGGQKGDYPARHVVGFEQANAAARAFLADQRLDPEQTWERQP